VLFVIVCAGMAFRHLVHGAVKIVSKHAASMLELDMLTATFLLPKSTEGKIYFLVSEIKNANINHGRMIRLQLLTTVKYNVGCI